MIMMVVVVVMMMVMMVAYVLSEWLRKETWPHYLSAPLASGNRYDGPIELFSCFTCLWGSQPVFQQYKALPDAARSVPFLRRLRGEYEVAKGQTPHPLTLLSHAEQKCRQQQSL
jgi:hypothetical protein